MSTIQESIFAYLTKSFYMNSKGLAAYKRFNKDLKMSHYEIEEVVAYIEHQFRVNLPNPINTDELSIAQLCEWAYKAQSSLVV